MLQDIRDPKTGAFLFKFDPETRRVEMLHRHRGNKVMSEVVLPTPTRAETVSTVTPRT